MWVLEIRIGGKWQTLTRSLDDNLVTDLGVILRKLGVLFRPTWVPKKETKEVN